MDKLFIQAGELLKDSYQLAWQVFESGYRPNYIIGVWRGGAPIGIAVQEFLDVLIKSINKTLKYFYESAISNSFSIESCIDEVGSALTLWQLLQIHQSCLNLHHPHLLH